MPVNPRAIIATIAVLVATPLFGLFVVPLLSLAPHSTAYAQDQEKPSITIEYDLTGPVPKGEELDFTLTFNGLNYIGHQDLTYSVGVVGKMDPDVEACEGTGFGNDMELSTGNQDSVTRTGTISSGCPVGEFILIVSLSKENEFQASAAKGFRVAPRIMMDIPGDNGDPAGLWGDIWGDRAGAYLNFFVPDKADRKIYVHRLYYYDDDQTQNIDESTTLTRTSSFDLASTTSPWGIVEFGHNYERLVFVSNDGTGVNDKLFTYTKDGERRAGEEFNLAADNTDPRGMHYTGSSIYVADYVDAKIYSYDRDDNNAHESSDDYDTLQAAGNTRPTGIWASGHTMFVANDGANNADDKIYAYDMLSKEREPHLDINALNLVGNNSPGGIWSDNTTIYVVDTQTKKLHAYPLPKRKRSPQITSGLPNVEISENSTRTGARYTGSHPENRHINWQVYPSNDDSRYLELNNNQELVFTSPPDFENPKDENKDNIYHILVIASSSSVEYTLFPVQVKVTDEIGEQPYFTDTSTTRTIVENTPAGVNIGDPVEAVIPDFGPTIYSLGGPDAASFDFSTSTGQIVTKDALNYESKSSYSVRVSVRDNEDQDGNDSTAIDDTIDVTISLTDLAEGPEVTGPAQVDHDENDLAHVADYDATDSQNRSIIWSLEGDDAGDFSISNGALTFRNTPNYEAAADADTDNEYLVTVIATAGTETGEVDVTVNVIDLNESPTFSSSQTTRSVAEGTQSGRDVGAPVEATDPDGDSLHYTLGGTDAASFSIVAATGQIQTSAALDFEGKRTYSVTVDVRDSKDDNGSPDAATDASIDVSINLTGEDEPPTLTGTTTTEYAENGTGPVAEYTATDPESQGITWDLSGDDADDFSITGGILRFLTPPDREDPADDDTNNEYHVTVEASDGTTTSTLDVTVTVTDVNEPPTVNGTSTTEYAENDTRPVANYIVDDPENDHIIWSLSGAGSDDMNISGGELSFNDPPNYEEQSVYQVTVQAFDGNSTGTLPVVITITDVNEAPEFPSATANRSVQENSGANAPVGLPVTAEDPDSGDTLTYILNGTDDESFTINSSTGQIRTKSDMDGDTKSTYSVTVEVHDGKADDGSASTTTDDSINVTITVTDVNEPPVLTGSTSVDLPENSTTTVATYTATDPEEDVTPIWDLSGVDADDFEIAGGVLTFKSLPDREGATDANTDSVYHVTIVASDGNNNAELPVTITVTNVNEKPAFPSSETGQRSVVENTGAGQSVGVPVAATDPDRGDTLTYELAGTDASSFNFNTGSGQILTKDDLDSDTQATYSRDRFGARQQG